MLKIGSHVSFSNRGLLSAAQEAVSYGATSFMIYTGAPQNTRRKPLDELYIESGTQFMHDQGIDEIVVHAPYIINLASYKSTTYELAVNFLQEEIRRTDALGVQTIVLHPGAFTDKDTTYGISRIAQGLDEVLAGVKNTAVRIALETMAGKGTELGKSFEQIAQILDLVEYNERLTVCLDTCHMHDAGYNIAKNLDDVLRQFDHIVGLDRVAVVHVNDSKNPLASHKDRHCPLGTGYIGFDTLYEVVHHDWLKGRPFILETPWIGKQAKQQRPMYEIEIALLRGEVGNRFGPAFLTDMEKINNFFHKEQIDIKAFIENTWNVLKNDAKAKKLDPREPLERLYDNIVEAQLFPTHTEERRNQLLIAAIANYTE